MSPESGEYKDKHFMDFYIQPKTIKKLIGKVNTNDQIDRTYLPFVSGTPNNPFKNIKFR